MRGSRKTKRVSWASDENLCQVKLFLSEDSPSQVGLGAQDHLQAKASWLLHSTGIGSDDNLPPGFEGPHSVNQWKDLSHIPIIKWKRPPSFVLNPDWQVAAGEECKEVEVQNSREKGELEAVYPRPSAIPPSPSVSLEMEDYNQNDTHIPLIPITPIEDEDMVDPSSDFTMPINTTTSSQMPILPPGFFASHPPQPHTVALSIESSANEKPSIGIVPGVEPDVVAAASAAFTAIMRSNEQGSLVDRDLLIKILSNPKLIEKLVSEYGSPAISQVTSKPRSPPLPVPTSQPGQPPMHLNRIESNTPPLPPAPATGHFYPVSNTIGPTLNPRPPPGIVQIPSGSTMKAPPKKDINYFKSLIQQHGGERQETQDPALPQFGNRNNQHPQPVQSSKPKSMKPCKYFNSSRGCRHGTNCMYQHDASLPHTPGSLPELQNAKRMKMDREITGRT